MNNHFIKAKCPTYNSCDKCYCIKDIYKNTEPYDNLFSFHWNNLLFKSKDDAYRELILYVFFEWNYNKYKDIKNISINPITDEDIANLNKFLEWHLRKFGFSWEITEMQILFNMEESK